MRGLVHRLVENTTPTRINYPEVAFYVSIFIVILVVLIMARAWGFRRISSRDESNPVYNNNIENSYLSYMRVPTFPANSVGCRGYSQGVGG